MLVRNVDTLSGSPLSVFLQNYIVLQHTVKMIVSQNPALLMSRQARHLITVFYYVVAQIMLRLTDRGGVSYHSPHKNYTPFHGNLIMMAGYTLYEHYALYEL